MCLVDVVVMNVCCVCVCVCAQVVEHKQQIMLEAKRKKAMDLHLDYIVDQTTKYSDWIAKDLGHPHSSSSSTRVTVTPGSVEGQNRGDES